MRKEWRGFKGNKWKSEVNLRDFIQNNYTPYEGDEKFLVGATDATNTLWGELQKLQKEESKKSIAVISCRKIKKLKPNYIKGLLIFKHGINNTT